ncbi:MAG: hypothetical protein V1737_00555 [Chloroflexota bacterium]
MEKAAKPGAELEKEGWKEASRSSGDHLERIVQMYNELGMETCLEEVGAQECGGCTQCFLASGEPLYRIYTRRKPK